MLCIFPFEADLYNQADYHNFRRPPDDRAITRPQPSVAAATYGSTGKSDINAIPISWFISRKPRREGGNLSDSNSDWRESSAIETKLRFEVAAASDELATGMEEC